MDALTDGGSSENPSRPGPGASDEVNEGAGTSDASADSTDCSDRRGGVLVELCNGVDDDCDGVVDEDCPCLDLDGDDYGIGCQLGPDCDDANPSVHAMNACGDCNTSPVEVCDGADNDCDGETDEGFSVGDEQCNGTDDDCDGEVDEGFPSVCVSGCTPTETSASLALAIVVDTSASMSEPMEGESSRLEVTIGALSDFILGLDGTTPVAVGRFPTSGCESENPLITGFSTSAPALVEALFALSPSGGTPVAAVYEALRPQLEANLDAPDVARMATVLITDGEPTCADGVEGAAAAIQSLRDLWPPVETTVINLGTSSAGIDTLAVAGGVLQHSLQVDTSLALAAALQSGTYGAFYAEVCNGVDDDCDGMTDEGVTNACGGCGPAPAETCDGIDQECDGAIDEDFLEKGQPCDGDDSDLCATGTYSCAPDGLSTVCANEAAPEQVEVCDSLDNDCDGQFNEDCEVCTFEGDTVPTAAGQVERVAFANGATYVVSKHGGLHGFGPAYTRTATVPRSSSAKATDVVVDGDRVLFVDGFLTVLDTSNLMAPAVAGKWGNPPVAPTSSGEEYTQVQHVALSDAGAVVTSISGAYGVVGDPLGALHVLDVADPTSIEETGTLALQDFGAGRLVAHAGAAYAHANGADGLHRVLVVDLGDPSAPSLATYWEAPESDWITDMAIRNGYLYVVGGSSGWLAVLDVSDALAPELVGSWNPPMAAVHHVAVGDQYACISGSTASLGIRLISIADPASPYDLMGDASAAGWVPFQNVKGPLVALPDSGFVVANTQGGNNYGLTVLTPSCP